MKKNKIIYILLGIVIAILTSIFVYKYVKNEHPIYIYDYGTYHQMYKDYAQKLLTSRRQFLGDEIDSIRNLDYNSSPILLILPFYLIFRGGQRLGYILGLCLVYVVPTIILVALLAKKMLFKNKEIKHKNIVTIFLCLLAFLYTRWWTPTLRGLPDIIAVIPIIIAALIVQKNSFIHKIKIYIPFLVGFLLYTCFLFRRYFIYAIIGFYGALFIVELIEFFKLKQDKKSHFWFAVRNFAIAGITTLFCVLIVQTPLVKHILGENYSEAYSAYQVPFGVHIRNTLHEFGYVFLIIALIGFIYAIAKKEHRKNGLFCLLNIIICYGTFMTVQYMSIHHYLTISPWIFILFCYGVYGIYDTIKNKYAKLVWLVIVMILMLLNFASTFIFRNMEIPVLTQNNKYCKLYYENYDELKRLVSDINDLVSNDNHKVSVLASSEILSDNVVYLVGTDKIRSNMKYINAIDLRDGMNFNCLTSDYIVVTDIAQTGTSADGQRIISVPNDAIYNSTTIGKAYSMLSGPYTLEKGIKAYIYKKNRSFTEEEVQEYMNILTGYYPQWKEEYNEFDKAVLMSEITLGEKLGDYLRVDNDTLYILPGDTPTIFTAKIRQKIQSIDLKLYMDGQFETQDDTAGSVYVTIKCDDSVVYEGEVNKDASQDVTIELSNCNDLTFIVDKNEYLNCDWLYIDYNNIVFKE